MRCRNIDHDIGFSVVISPTGDRLCAVTIYTSPEGYRRIYRRPAAFMAYAISPITSECWWFEFGR